MPRQPHDDPLRPGRRQEHDGTLYLMFNTIVTPFIAPVVDLSTPKAKASLIGNIVWDGGVKQSRQTVATVRNDAKLSDVTGTYNWFSGDFGGVGSTGLDAKTNLFRRADGPIFVNPARARLPAQARRGQDGRLSACSGEARRAGRRRGDADRQRQTAGVAIRPSAPRREADRQARPDVGGLWTLTPENVPSESLTPHKSGDESPHSKGVSPRSILLPDLPHVFAAGDGRQGLDGVGGRSSS